MAEAQRRCLHGGGAAQVPPSSAAWHDAVVADVRCRRATTIDGGRCATWSALLCPDLVSKVPDECVHHLCRAAVALSPRRSWEAVDLTPFVNLTALNWTTVLSICSANVRSIHTVVLPVRAELPQACFANPLFCRLNWNYLRAP